MFFAASKILWMFAKPLNLLALLFLFGLALKLKWKRTGQGVLVTSILLFIILGCFPVGYNMMVFLETRYERLTDLPPKLEGVVVLGGSLDAILSKKHRYPVAYGSVERLHEAITLLQQYPMAEVVVSGGSGYLGHPHAKEAPHVMRFMNRLNVPNREWILYEMNSRNTYENVLFSQKFMMPHEGERWIVITSAYHMPRSMAIFEQLGWDVMALPTDHRTDGQYRLISDQFDIQKNFQYLDTALREFVGLFVYGLTGKSARMWPE